MVSGGSAARRLGGSALLALAMVLSSCCGSGRNGPQELVVVPPGASVRIVADSLAAHRVIKSRFWFRMLAKMRGKERELQRGAYSLPRGAGSNAALDALVSGKAILQRFTIPEGFTLIDMAGVVESTLAIPRDRFLAAAHDTATLREFRIPGSSFEGYLRPETCLVAPGLEAGKIVRVMVERFLADWKPEWDSLARGQGLDRNQVVVLASIVEAEAKVDSDRPLIAAVYRNRLRLGMPLQADATILYGMQLASARKTRLYEKDYGFVSPYNTYLHGGLPPGPVGAPGSRSIEAVLRPGDVPFLYYVARTDGGHVFSRTYSEHLRAVRLVQSGSRRVSKLR
jgi:UPF0755 protein